MLNLEGGSMRIRSTVRLIVSLSVLTALPPILLARGQKTIEARASIGQTLKSLPGQTVSLLPDGTWLVVGGNGEHGPVDIAAIKSPDASSTTRLQSHLRRSRAWHTATLLPDGTVLVLGGVGADGQITDSAELFHPDTHSFEVIPSPGFTPRAYHTATALTEGRVLIAGGISNEGETLGGARFGDP